MLLDVSTGSWKNISDGLGFVTQTWRWDKCDDPNAIHGWCGFKYKVINRPNYHKNHFSLMEESQTLLETALDVNI